MSSHLEDMARTIVDNVHQTWLYKAIEEWCRKDSLEIREEMGLASFSITSSDSTEMYQRIKRHLLSKTFHDANILQFLMDVPRWAGFTLDSDEFQSGQQVIGAAKDEAISLLWLMAIPRLIISPTTLPEEYPIVGVKEFISHLLASDQSRELLVEYMSNALESRGIPDITFAPCPIGRGYTIDESMRAQRIQMILALVIMRATALPFDLDKVFSLKENQLAKEASAYIISMQARSMLKNQITGGGTQRPFDWPLIGNPNVCNKLFTTLNALKQSASLMTTSSMYSTESGEERKPWNEQEFVSFLLNEIVNHYSEIRRTRHGKSKYPELDLFIELLSGNNTKIAEKLLDIEDPGTTLFEELNKSKQKAKTGEKPEISPERRFKIILSSLKQMVSKDKHEEISSEEIIDQIIEAFDAIVEVVGRHRIALGEESERFAQALCFETSYRVLQLLDLGEALMDIPWVSRFIAEESARLDISEGAISHLDDEYRIKRIVSAYAGGLTYLILQSSN